MLQEARFADNDMVSCEVCLKEIPDSEAGIVEAEDYVIYFCGLECYHIWRERKLAAQDRTS